MRTSLKPQETIVLSSGSSVRKFVIEKCLGKGASCYVYEGCDLEQKKRVRIKELCPTSAQVTRTGQELKWMSWEEKEAFIGRFESAAKVQMEFSNAEGTGNSTVHLDGVYSGNGTEYLVMEADFGKTFDQDDSKDLHDILRSILALTNAVGAYHRAGFLHLDIKPENFLIVPETRELVKIFDTDTMVKKTELFSANYFSYTQKWAASEQKMGRIHNICEATDLYAIGKILFDRVMGRMPNNDDMTPFSDWAFNESVFARVNPAVKPKMRVLFRRTLAASVRKRYQSAEELASAIQEILRITGAGRPYLLSDYPQPGNVIGRDRELEELRAKFAEGTHSIFLYGFGGVGKTALAKFYAKEQEDVNYDAVVWLSCCDETPLEKCILQLQIAQCSEDALGSRLSPIKQKKKILQEICKEERILFIIDNFDTNDCGQDDFLTEFLRLPADFLITTRNDHSYFEQSCQMEIGCLEDKDLLELFELHSNSELSDCDKEIALQMLHAIGGNTLFTVLLARQLVVSNIGLETLRRDLFAQEEKVRLVHGESAYQLTQREWLKTIWNISALGDEMQETLRNVWLLQTERWDKQAYKELTGAKSLDALNALIEGSWIQWESTETKMGKLSLHPLIEELVKFDLDPQYRNCKRLGEHFDILLHNKQNFLREDILIPKHILHTMTKWLEVEESPEEMDVIFSKICCVLVELLQATKSSGEMAFYHAFDECFVPKMLFDPLMEISQKHVGHCLDFIYEAESAASDYFKWFVEDSPKWETSKECFPTEEDKCLFFWGITRRELDKYLEGLCTHILLCFWKIRFLSAYDGWMNEWGIWDDWEEENHLDEMSPSDINYREIKKCIDAVTLHIAEYDQVVQYYYQKYFSSQELREDAVQRYYIEDSMLIWPETVIQWYWPIIFEWTELLGDNAIEATVTTETGMLYRTVYELMRNTLTEFMKVLADAPEKQDSWGNYRELEDSLVNNVMSLCAWRMEKSGQPNADVARLYCGAGYEPKTREELLSFQIPEFPPPQC